MNKWGHRFRNLMSIISLLRLWDSSWILAILAVAFGIGWHIGYNLIGIMR